MRKLIRVWRNHHKSLTWTILLCFSSTNKKAFFLVRLHNYRERERPWLDQRWSRLECCWHCRQDRVLVRTILRPTTPQPCFDFTQVRFCSVFAVFPLLSLFFCLVPLFSLYMFCFFLSTLSTTYQSYLGTVLRSFIGWLILLRISILTTLVAGIRVGVKD